MEIFLSLSLVEWIILIAIFAACGGACWLNHDSRKRGLVTGGRACGGCPHYCQLNRNCDGSPKAEEGELKPQQK